MKQHLVLFALTALLLQIAFADVQTDEEILQNIVDGLKSSQQNGADAGANFAQNVKSVTQIFAQQAKSTSNAAATPQNINTQLEDSISAFVTSVQGLRLNVVAETEIIANGLKRTALIQAANELKKTNASALALQSHMSDLRDNADENVQEQLDTITADWNKFSNAQLRVFGKKVDNDEATVAKAKTTMDEFVGRMQQYVQGCADDVTNEVEQFETKVQASVEDYQNHVDQLQTEVQTCLDSDYRPAANQACRNKIRRALVQLQKAPAQFRKFGTDGANLQKVQITKRNCVVKAQAQFKAEGYFIERSLNKMATEHKESAGSDNGDGAGSGNGDGAGSDNGDGAGSGNGDGAGSGTGDGAGSGNGDGAGSGNADGADSANDADADKK